MRQFTDWSPASVFGSTDNNGQQREHSDMSDKLHDETLSRPEAESLSLTSEDAARILQRRLRVWLLYRRELESIQEVERVQEELQLAAAQAIVDWLVRWGKRQRIVAWAAALRRCRELQRRSASGIASWICQQQCRRCLRKRIHSRRRLICWWRRIQLHRRCYERQMKSKQDSEAATRSFIEKRAAKAIARFVAACIVRRKAASLVSCFVLARAHCRRSSLELNHLRRHRRGVLSLESVAVRWTRRHHFLKWVAAIASLRTHERQRAHSAACVLQRLARVMITAFRLIRRRDAATRIQSLIRGKQSRLLYKQLIHRRCEVAATNIQRVARGRMARRRYSDLLRQLRERFQCLNCGLIEPGGLYCKFCGRRRTTFAILPSGVAAASSTTEMRLRRRRRRHIQPGDDDQLPPAAPSSIRTKQLSNLCESSLSLAPTPIKNVTLPEPRVPGPSPLAAKGPSRLVLSPRAPSGPKPMPPARSRMPQPPRAASGRPGGFHRSPSDGDANLSIGLASVEKTQQRADALMRQDASTCASSGALNLHLQRLQKAGKAASR